MQKLTIAFYIWVINVFLILMAQIPQSENSQKIFALTQTGIKLVDMLEDKASES